MKKGVEAKEERTGSLVRDSGSEEGKREGRATRLLGNAKYMGLSI